MSQKKINVLFIADIVGKPGLDITTQILPALKKKYDVHFTIANGENGADGKGITEELVNQYHSIGIDLITSGNHIWERHQFLKYLHKSQTVLRPLNYPEGNVGRGYAIIQIADGLKIGVINLQGRTFMYPINCPFRTASWAISRIKEETNIILIDFHAEATAEKIALGWYLDGQISGLMGTHTHVQTADERILPEGTAFITDAGMTGAFDSVIGMKKEVAIERFMRQTPRRYQIAEENLHLCGVVISVDTATGKATDIQRVQFPKL